MAGALTAVLTCVQGTTGLQGLCPDGWVPQIQTAYLIPASEAQSIEAFLAPFDPTHVAQLFFGAMSVTVAVWLVSWGIGAVVRAVKNF